MGCLVLSVDYYISFKHNMAIDIENYINEHGKEPKALIIDAPRDEETKYLHKIDGALEDLKNGRIFSSFGGKRIGKRIKIEKPIFVFSNSPPVFDTMSEDR